MRDLPLPTFPIVDLGALPRRGARIIEMARAVATLLALRPDPQRPTRARQCQQFDGAPQQRADERPAGVQVPGSSAAMHAEAPDGWGTTAQYGATVTTS